jgi:phosphoribosyl-ATP pyrophosphohydrolase/phosphoribosyl-AMP cyclohydrolase
MSLNVDFQKFPDALVPAIVQDQETRQVLMLGYMNQDALDKTLASQKVTFFSRSKKRLWTKGEESGNFLELVEIQVDCDSDALLVKVNPVGPTCHKGTDTCWGEDNQSHFGFISRLEETIEQRRTSSGDESYVKRLFGKGLNKIAQKVGEEAVEVVIEAKDDNTELFLNECADLLFHYLMLLQAKGHRLEDVVEVLQGRAK